MRVRAEAKNAPAPPTTARTAVGFSGELRHPLCAWSGRVTERMKARPRNMRLDFFIDGLHFGRAAEESICWWCLISSIIPAVSWRVVDTKDASTVWGGDF